jgi:hypothetical protein
MKTHHTALVAIVAWAISLVACAEDAPPAPPPETPRDVRMKVDGGTASALVPTASGIIIGTTPATGLGRGAIWRVAEDRRVDQLRETSGPVRALDVDTSGAAVSFAWSEEAGGLYAADSGPAPPTALRPVSVNVLSFARTGGAFSYATPTGVGRTDTDADQELGPGDRALASDGTTTFVLTMKLASPQAPTRPWELSALVPGAGPKSLATGEGAQGSGAMARSLTTDATNVYAAVAGVGIVSVPKSGGAATTLAPRPSASLPVAEGRYVYFADNADGDAALLRVASGGGAVEPVVRARGAIVTALAVDGGFVYWAGIDGGVYRAAKP